MRNEDRRVGIRLSFALALLLAAGCGSGEPGARSGSQSPSSPEETMATDLPLNREGGGLQCGAELAPVTRGLLKVNGRFPAAVSALERVVTGSVDVTSNSREASGVVTPQADAFLVHDGRIVTLPLPQDSIGRELDLKDGKVERLPAVASLVPCSGASGLAPGSYDVYARVVLNNADGSRADSIGGPWPLEVG